MAHIDLVALQQRLAQQQLPKPAPAEPPSWSTRPAPTLRTMSPPKARPASAASAEAPVGTLRATTTMRAALPLEAMNTRAERAKERTRANVLQTQITALAIYGACLSTILALAKIIPEWPVVTPVPLDGPDTGSLWVSLSVSNPAKRSLFVEGNKQFPRTAPAFHLREGRTLDLREEIAQAYADRMGLSGSLHDFSCLPRERHF